MTFDRTNPERNRNPFPAEVLPPIPPRPVKPKRDRPDWPTYRVFGGIALGTLLAFFITARSQFATVIAILIWIAFITAVVSYTKYDRRRRLRGKEG